MFNQSSKNSATALADQAAHSADNAIKSTKRVANDVLDDLADGVQDARDQASALVQRGMDSVRETTQHLQESAQRASHSTVKFIKDEPVKSILIAAATGAALMALIGLMSRNHGRN
jgi:ElaB/YqjD/DUF883 family membrane-anchored ribosome-binding protein